MWVYKSERQGKITLCSQPQPKLIVRLVISKVERKLIVVSILYLLVVRSCSIRKWELRNPSNIGCKEKFRRKKRKITMGRDNNRGHGGGSCGRGRGCGRQFNKFQSNKTPEIKFYPNGSGKQGQTVTYATVKEHIISYVQRIPLWKGHCRIIERSQESRPKTRTTHTTSVYW